MALKVLAAKLSQFSSSTIFLDSSQIITVNQGLSILNNSLSEIKQTIAKDNIFVIGKRILLQNYSFQNINTAKNALESLLIPGTSNTNSSQLPVDNILKVFDSLANYSAVLQNSGTNHFFKINMENKKKFFVPKQGILISLFI